MVREPGGRGTRGKWAHLDREQLSLWVGRAQQPVWFCSKDRPFFPSQLTPQPWQGALGGGQRLGGSCLPGRGYALFVLGSLKLTVSLGP